MKPSNRLTVYVTKNEYKDIMLTSKKNRKQAALAASLAALAR